MISQSLYHALCIASSQSQYPGLHRVKEELARFTRPYVLIIHQPTGRGFYLDRDYRHIIDVYGCQEPKRTAEVTQHHLCASSNPPDWAKSEKTEEFNTFWLY